ncbi:MAG: ABC transporter ATP-binding protein [Promethearchaeota archaeon]
MAKIIYKNITKKFGDFVAVDKLNLEVQDREFVCFVGPSGCGKTTSLRMLAGLEDITDGTIQIDDEIVNDIPPKFRDIAMVFQSYALYPHYNIFENLAFGLRSRKVNNVAKSMLSLLKILIYGLGFGVFIGLSALASLALPGRFGLIAGGSIGSILIMLFMFPEVRIDINEYIMKLGSSWFKMIKSYLENEEVIREKVFETSKLLGIESELWKKPKQLSGGQRQRVALGRAIIRNPKAFLMDEPLSNLDAKLRVQMRAELERLTQKLQVTSLYVTHDQIEAMTLSDRIAVMNKGKVNQVGTPEEVYNTPVNLFVAGFIGSPAMNFITGHIKKINEGYQFVSEAFNYPIPDRYNKGIKDFMGKEVILGIRPEHIELDLHEKSKAHDLQATVGVLEPIGSDTFIYLDFPGYNELIVKEEGIFKVKIDQELFVSLLDDQLHFFDKESGDRILPEGGLAKMHHYAALEAQGIFEEPEKEIEPIITHE